MKDRDRLEALYRAYGHAVHRRCRRILRTEAEADDVLQEVFMRVHRYGIPEALESELGWLYRIADRCCFDAMKKRRATSPLSAVPEAGASGPDECALALRRALEACPDELREAGVLYYLDEMSQEEVAGATGLSRKVVRGRIARFRSLLARFLGPREVLS